MLNRFHTLWAQTPVRLCLVLWSFGYALVEISATMQGRTSSGMMLIPSLPLLVLGVILSLSLDWLMRHWGDRHALLRWPVIAIATVGAGGVQTLTDMLWHRSLALTIFPSWQSWALNTDPSRIFTVFLLYTWTLTLSLALIWSSRSNDVAKLNEARAAAFEAAATRAEAAALRLQLNPHFLFNTLNGIASLVVRRKTDQADEMIGRLADFLRSSLAADPNALIPLRQELATVRAYLHLEQARLGDKLRLVCEIEEEVLEVSVPNFLMQPLIENAVKHGVTHSTRGATIQLEAKRDKESLVISVANREIGSGSAKPKNGSDRAGPLRPGIGLANTRQRLLLLYGDQAWVKATRLIDGYYCEIGLPAILASDRGTEAK